MVVTCHYQPLMIEKGLSEKTPFPNTLFSEPKTKPCPLQSGTERNAQSTVATSVASREEHDLLCKTSIAGQSLRGGGGKPYRKSQSIISRGWPLGDHFWRPSKAVSEG